MCQNNILRFWRDVEIFNIPSVPKGKNVVYVNGNNAFPWQKDDGTYRPTKDYYWEHFVFVGVADSSIWAATVLKELLPDGGKLDRHEFETVKGKGWAAGFIVNGEGVAQPESYVRASFGVALEWMENGKRSLEGLEKSLTNARDEFANRCLEHSDQSNCSNLVDLGFVSKEVQTAVGARRLTTNEFKKLPVVIKSVRKKRLSENDDSIEFMNSFFLNDLDELIAQTESSRPLGNALASYLGAESQRRTDILTNNEAMAMCLEPARLSAGRWPSPSKHHLMLAQQAAVGEILSTLKMKTGIVAVNGPPGTGKTTLLCDIVADIVVERAQKLAQLQSPHKAFESKTCIGGVNVFPIKSFIVGGTGIVVSSNNNAAVENITRELPSSQKVDLEEHPAAGYFTEVAQNIFNVAKVDDTAWGLVAAALGNKANRGNFVKSFFSESNERFDEGQPCDIRTRLEAAVKTNKKASWFDAKDEFQRLYNEVRSDRKNWEAVFRTLREIDELDKILIDKNTELERLEASWRAEEVNSSRKFANINGQVQALERSVYEASSKIEVETNALSKAALRAKVVRTQEAPNLWDKLCCFLGYRTANHRLWHKKLAAVDAICRTTEASLGEARRRLQDRRQDAARERHILSELKKHRSTCAQIFSLDKEKLQTAIRAVLAKIQRYELEVETLKMSGATVPDKGFFSLDPKHRHLKSAWVTEEFDLQRSRLFMAAMRLHEETILANALKVIPNMRLVSKMLEGISSEPIKPEDLPKVWDMLFFVVPVISTALASFERLFKGMGSESLGWLLIDEAGQATPQSVAGALWRSQRAVIIGDPQQVEPVMTVSPKVIAMLRELHGVETDFSPAQTSAQKLADRTMTRGAWIGDRSRSDAVWTGMPLRAHRRCIEPMFSVANQIAYDNQMVQANLSPAKIIKGISASVWLDVAGRDNEEQVVMQEMEVFQNLLELIKKDWPETDKGPIKIYAISPFKSVAIDCNKKIKDVFKEKEKLPIQSGTVHAFQGKEAELVILVFGSAPGKKGEPSRAWAASTPNLLNVALTRAKSHIVVIGSYSDWSACAHFDTLAAQMTQDKSVMSPENYFESLKESSVIL